MIRQPVVMWDIDGVIADFMTGFLRLAKTLYPEKHIELYPDGNHPSWDTASQFLESHEVAEVWGEVVNSVRFWRELPCLVSQEEREAIYRNSFKWDFVFITNRYGTNVKHQTERWLNYHIGLMNPTVILSEEKGRVARALGAVAGIEDKYDNAVNLLNCEVTPYLIDRPYNRNECGLSIRRVKSVVEFIEELNGEEAHESKRRGWVPQSTN